MDVEGEEDTMWYTANAENELMREKDYTPEEICGFLKNPEKFMSLSAGLKRELRCLGYEGTDEQLLNNFMKLLGDKSLNSAEYRQERKWFKDAVLPRRESAVKLCFAFGLDEQQALDFLWKVCKLNGFNFRRARDIVFCYCLANKRSYDDALNLLIQYDAFTVTHATANEPYTKTTQSIRGVFRDLKGMSEQDFMDNLYANKKNFIGYSVFAHKEFVRVYSEAVAQLELKITEDSASGFHDEDVEDADGVVRLTYKAICNEFVCRPGEDNAYLAGNDYPVKRLCRHIKGLTPTFLKAEDLKKLHNDPQRASEKEHGSSRKVFVFFYFVNFVLRWGRFINGKINETDPPVDYFYRFYYGLNASLDECGYGYLYYADPFDWLILNCVMSLNENDQSGGGDDLDALSLFNETLAYLTMVNSDE